MKKERLTESFKRIFNESFNISSDYYADETANEITKMYSWGEVQKMDDDDLYEAIFDVATQYVDGDDEEFDAEVIEIADKALTKVRNNPFNESKLSEGLQYGKGSNPPTEKDEEIAEKFCILMDWEIAPDDIWQVYDYGDGKATISVSKDMNATMADGEVSDLDDVYYFDYENDYIISKESEDLAKMHDEEYEEPDPADRDMGEMYGNYRGDASFFESKLLPHERLMEGGYTTFTNHLGELDSFYDPYKKEPADVPYEPIFASEDYKGRFFKGLDFKTKEGLEKAADRWNDYYFSDFIHDIGHDGDKAGARSASIALNSLLTEIKRGAVLLGLTEDDVNGPLKDIIKDLKDAWKRRQAAEKRKATKEANRENRAKAYAEELRNTDLPPELKELFADDGFYKERRSWGTIKDYFNEPYGKALKQLWVNQFGK